MKTNITVTEEQINEICENTLYSILHRVYDKTCVVVALLPNGFVITESSACVDPANYDEQIGEQICKDRIKNKIWELEGYKLQSIVSGGLRANAE